MFNSTLTRICFIATICFTMSACSTRESADQYRGSTSQRLLTYSINELVSDLPDNSFTELGSQSIYVRTHFISKTEALVYAEQRLKMELASRFKLNLVDSAAEADIEFDFFFTSLGTDQDVYGLSVPVFWVSTDGEMPSLDILAVRMYHGVSEMYYFIKDKNTGVTTAHDGSIARSRSDKFSTPFFSFPIDSLKEKSVLD
ncbi:hypothetical protein [Moritella sp. F3]|uniref:hypothetical protein n=1 Tax=Moritella sp. F3 TaxID=2718882 RepID=UPI0018E16753|nr:hypothetical protein [Moritella sp. F3]GIC75446.1 hypothetical protein FMO001_01730 [Moritella sp. F1]GIC80591.1 hypothetical protein FMO003_08720 [Moritella sp. F3]